LCTFNLAIPLLRSCNRPRPLVMMFIIHNTNEENLRLLVTQLREICRRTNTAQIKGCSDHFSLPWS
jgi:hypothetical protein